MIGLLNVMEIIIGLIAIQYDPDISQEAMEYLQHGLFCCLIEALAEVTGTDDQAVFQFLKPASDQAEGHPTAKEKRYVNIQMKMGDKQHE